MVLLRYIIKQPNCEEEELYQINPKFRHNNENVNDTIRYVIMIALYKKIFTMPDN